MTELILLLALAGVIYLLVKYAKNRAKSKTEAKFRLAGDTAGKEDCCYIPYSNLSEEYSLANIIPENCCLTNLKAWDFHDAICKIVEHLYKNKYINSSQKCMEAIEAREKMISTMLPGGIALPHARTNCAERMISVIALCELKQVEKTEENEEPFKGKHIIVLTVSPKDGQQPYMQYIAHIASVLSKCMDLEELRTITSPQELRSRFIRL